MANNNSLQPKQDINSMNISSYLSAPAISKKINDIVGGANGQRFITAIISAVNTNPALKECTNTSIVNAALLGETLKLSPSPQLGYYYMVPYKIGDIKEAQFQIGYKGYIQLAIRTKAYKKINVIELKAGELGHYDPLNEEISAIMIEDPEERENAETIGYYAMFELNNGFRKTMYWSKAKMEGHAIKYSKGYKAKKGYTFWEKNFDEMAKKTMLRQLLSKWGLMTIEMETAIDNDMAVLKDNGSKVYVDNQPEEPITFDNETGEVFDPMG